LAYVLASWFTYLYVRTIAADGLAAVAAGLFFGMSGFLMAHLGHATMVHAAAWTPCILWAFEELWHRLRLRWILVGAAATSQCILAGHPQIALYGLAVASAYAALRMILRSERKLRYGCAVLSTLVLGVLLCSIQIFSTATLSRMTPRVSMSFAEFGEYSLEPFQLAALLFPCLFGGGAALTLDGIPDLGKWGVTETAGYMGLSALVLATIAVLSRRRELVVLFWAAASIVSLLASLGTSTPLGRLLYLTPGFGQFRAQGRFMFLFCLTVAILAGIGITALRKSSARVRNTVVVIAGLIALVSTALLIEPMAGNWLRVLAASHGVPNLPVSLLANRWIWIPVMNSVVVTILLLAVVRWPASIWSRTALIAGIILEVGSFGWYAEWRNSPRFADLRPPPIAAKYRQKLNETNGRLLSVRGYMSSPREAPPDLAPFWNIPVIGKYGPLLPTRFRELLDIETNGLMLGSWWDSRNRSLDITGTRLVAVPADPPAAMETYKGTPFRTGDLDIAAGNGCGAVARSGSIAFARPKRAVAVGIVTFMGCSTSIEQGTPVLQTHFNSSGDGDATTVMRAGIDTAEWAAGCNDIVPSMRHEPAEVFARFPVQRANFLCEGQRYVTFMKLPKPMNVDSMEFRWLPAGDGIVRLSSIVFVDEQGHSDPVDPSDMRVGNPTRWKKFHQEAEFAVYENLRSQPRAWFVPETVTLAAGDVKVAIQTSKLPDGREYDPSAMALIEEPLSFRSSVPDPDARVWIVSDRNTAVDLKTVNKQPVFLVLGDFYYPGWTATVNGQPTPIYQTNYIQRGLVIPPGQNFVTFTFRPSTFYAGAGVSGSSLLLCLIAAVVAQRRRLL
jgi:hypothetical protein